MKKETLNGIWDYRIGFGAWEKICVPYSAQPVGRSEVKRFFDVDRQYAHVFLRFEGIAYAADVYVNGEFLGKMLPYCRYDFEITDIAQDAQNELRVVLEDIAPVFGPSEGWQNYGGVIHDVWLLYAGENRIEDAFFSCQLKNGYRDADVSFRVRLTKAAPVRVRLSREGKCALDRVFEGGDIRFSLEDVALWSPESPALYELSATVRDADADECKMYVGFREFSHNGRHFLLNGREIFLKGVCRHEMVGESGHTPTEKQIFDDLRAIKEAGMNFVRLVHYPHDAKTLEIADSLGLLVSEEPGLWWSDTENSEIRSGSVEVLRRTIRRDRNHACVAFWLCFNECRFTEGYLMESAAACREEDSTRLVSGANCMSDEDTLHYFDLCGFDFYTMHPYSETTQRAKRSAKLLTGKPLLFTEWGGHFVYDNPKLIGEFISDFASLYANTDENGTLAGACFWEWAEMYEFGRGTPACRDGILKEGLVDINRRETLIFDAYKNAWARMDAPGCPEDRYEYRAQGALEGMKALTCIGGGTDFDAALNEAREPIGRYLVNKRLRNLRVGPKLYKAEIPGMYPLPLTVGDGARLVFPVEDAVSKAVMLGGVSLPKGYPIGGEYGEAVLDFIFVYENGETDVHTLKNGEEITTCFTTFGPSQIHAVSEKGMPFARFSYDKNHENYKIDRLTIRPEKAGKVKDIVLQSSGNGYNALVYGLYIDTEGAHESNGDLS